MFLFITILILIMISFALAIAGIVRNAVVYVGAGLLAALIALFFFAVYSFNFGTTIRSPW